MAPDPDGYGVGIVGCEDGYGAGVGVEEADDAADGVAAPELTADRAKTGHFSWNTIAIT